MEPQENGFVMSYMGLLDIIAQSVGIRFLTEFYSENQLIIRAITIASFSFIGNKK